MHSICKVQHAFHIGWRDLQDYDYMFLMLLKAGPHRAEEAKREGDEDPDESHNDNRAERHRREGVVADGDRVERKRDREAGQREERGRQQHGPDPRLPIVARVEAATVAKHMSIDSFRP